MAESNPACASNFLTAGEAARTVVLLHGFPETWWLWASRIPALLAGGFRVVAPDNRGAGD
jgi:pimeloyl-ACP methyl ester carboxylesterase